MIDFDKPIRFVDSKLPARVIGRLLNGRLLVENANVETLVYEVDECGRNRNGSYIIENTTERITRWIIMTPHTGYKSKESALAAAEIYTGGCYTVLKVEVDF